MYTSQKFSLEIKEAGFEGESEKSYVKRIITTSPPWDFEYKIMLSQDAFFDGGTKTGDIIPAYDIIYDLCITYAKEVWGDKEYWKKRCPLSDNAKELFGTSEEKIQKSKEWKIFYEKPETERCGNCQIVYVRDYKYHTQQILSMLQQGKSQDEIESYIKTHSVLFLINPHPKRDKE